LLLSLPAFAQDYDLLIRGGRIVDGTGNPWFYADLGVRGQRIAAIGRLRGNARRVIDAEGMVVAPGFIDMHSHSDITLLVDGNAESKIRQGVTTEIFGESESPAPLRGLALQEFENGYRMYKLKFDWQDFGGYFARLLKQGVSVNVASYVGVGQLRLCVMGGENRAPSANERQEMHALVEQAMRHGALGISTGLIYPPSSYTTTGELVELARVAARHGGIYATHMRSEGLRLMEAVQEAIAIGEKAPIPVHVFHFKAAGKSMWGRMPEAVRLIEDARARGVDVMVDQYPYIAGMTSLASSLPPWAHEGGTRKLLDRLRDKSSRARIRRAMEAEAADWENLAQRSGGWDKVLIAGVVTQKNKSYEGRTVADMAKMRGQDPFEAVYDLLLEEDGVVGAIYFIMDEKDVQYAIAQPWVSIGSDGSAVKPEGVLGADKPHPRFYGTFPRVLGKYVREERVLRLEDAIRKMTSLGAQRLGLRDRGLLREGAFADLVVFDPQRVIDKATFENPHQYSEGIEYVVVNGRLTLEKGRHTGARAGQVLYGPGRASGPDR
jgi:N-acyl-D-aspartate/D-glutamate deacylase